MIKTKALRLDGDQYPFMANLRYFKDLLALPRAAAPKDGGRRTMTLRNPHSSPPSGATCALDIAGKPHRIYVEQAGEGIPLVCLHTAGADGRQYRGLMNDAETLARFRVIAFDLPWHGKSSPPAGWQRGEYKLTSRAYVDTIMAVIDALGLDKPVVMGCSIGGRIVLHLALEHATRFRALIGLESGAHAEPYYDLDWLHRSDVHGGEMCGAMISGLIAPTAPEADRWETIWHYMQGGPGVFKGDLHFYTADGDVRGRVAEIDTGKCPLYLLTGEYDYSATPEITRELAARIAGAEATIMSGPRPLPHERGPRPLPRLPAASAEQNRATVGAIVLPVRQLELDAAVAAEHFLAGAVLEGLELAVAGRHQPLGRHAAARSGISPPRWRARVDSSQLEGNCGLAIGRASVWPSTCSAQSISWRDGALQLDDGCRQLVDGGEAFRPSWSPGPTGTAPRTGTRSGRRPRGCPCGRAAARAGGRRSRSGSAAAPAPAGPARR